MAGFDWFDPYAIKFDQNRNPGAIAAKIANPANVYAADPLKTFAALASLATPQPPSSKNQVGEPAWSDADWRAYFSERTSFVERVRGLSNLEARGVAFSICVTEWLNRHSIASSKDRCLVCGRSDHNSDPLTPFGTTGSGHAWLHAGCWRSWSDEREKLARSALAEIGVC